MNPRAVTRPFPEFAIDNLVELPVQTASKRQSKPRRSKLRSASMESFRQMSIFEVRRRDRRHACRYRYVRKLPGSRLYQARTYLSPEKGGSINLGLYETEAAAHQVVTAWIRAGADPTKGLPPGVLPKYVKETEGGFTWSVVVGGKRMQGGLFANAADAFHDALREINAARGAS